MATLAQRAHMHALMQLLIAHNPQVHYPLHDRRGPLELATFKLTEQQLDKLLAHGGQIQADCSEMTTEICRWAGLQDPNGLAYRYAGYTGTMLAHLPHYTDPTKAGIGALCVFYGPAGSVEAKTGAHVAMVMEPGADPLMFTHGEESDPSAHKLSYIESGFHGQTFLSIAHL